MSTPGDDGQHLVPATFGRTTPTPRRRRYGLWFCLITFLLAIVASATLIVYNIRQQLRPEDLEKAWQLWKAKGPTDYELVYEVRRQDSPPETYVAQVRQRRTRAAWRNEQPLEARLLSYYNMDALFAQIQAFLQQDAQPQRPRVFTRAIFDPQDGHLHWYVRRVLGSSERVEITVRQLRPLP